MTCEGLREVGKTMVGPSFVVTNGGTTRSTGQDQNEVYGCLVRDFFVLRRVSRPNLWGLPNVR